MIRCFCHPALEKLLAQSLVKMMYLRTSVGVTFISSCLSKSTNFSYGGLLQTVKSRLANSSYNPVITLSFHTKEELVKQNTYGILSLHGIKYLKLPVSTDTHYRAIENYNKKHKDFELSISKDEWEQFSINILTTLLKEKINILNHGSRYDFDNSVTLQLKAVCVSSLT